MDPELIEEILSDALQGDATAIMALDDLIKEGVKVGMTLQDYINLHDHPVLFWVSLGSPMGQDDTLGNPNWELPDEGMLECTGLVNEEGWTWDGNGSVHDYNRNSITRMEAYNSAGTYSRLINEAGLGDDEDVWGEDGPEEWEDEDEIP